jgi:transcriptional regulator with XRE-family HTH domain
MTFKLRLREIAQARGTNLSGIARELGITSQAVGQWGAPGGTMPVGAKLKDIARILDVTESDLLAPVGAPFRGSGAALPVDAPKKTRLVDDPDQLALLDFWDDLGTTEERVRVFRILQAAVAPLSKRS